MLEVDWQKYSWAQRGQSVGSIEKYLDSHGEIVPITLLSLVLVFLISVEIREILFYRKNGWNFDLDSNVGLKVYNGDSNSEEDLTSNKSRVCYGTPFAIAVCAIALIPFVVFLFSK
ncbi:hypothetical protein NXC12_CH00559 [Rhizobium etli]|uniref:Uncharacterized protein n=1 Tax=Rhizobium etli TaxID=29449 RepID=A0AAN1BCZ2_RHIET|nr:hypothetical protein [Rhizobium etli]ARQ08647.1 hypothetical protein NXC12_CH00559 [Rhizobium etli]